MSHDDEMMDLLAQVLGGERGGELRRLYAQSAGDDERAVEAATVHQRGNDFLRHSRFREAIECYEQCVSVFQALGKREEEGMAFENMGIAFQSLGQHRKAIDCHEKCLAIAREICDRAGEGGAYSGLGLAYQSVGQYQEAIEYHEKHLAIAREIGDRAGEGKAYSGLGSAYYIFGQYRKAIEFYGKHLALAREVGDRAGECGAYGNLGNVLQSLGQYRKAIDHYEKALAIARDVGYRADEGRTLHNMGHTLLRQGDLQRSIEVLVQARDVQESLWDDLGTDETSKITVLEDLGKTYHALQEAQVKAGQHESALETAERGRARTLVDRLSRSDDTFPSEPLTASAMRSLAESCGTVVVVYSVVKEAQPQPPGTVYAGHDEYVYTWVITPDAITFDRRHPARLLEDMAADVANVISPSKFPSASTSVLTELYDLLIRPIESSLPLSDTDPPIITFIPQGPLLFVPFPALHDSETNLDLIDRCVVSISPCVAVLNRALTPPDPAQPRGLAVGNPEPVKGMAPLRVAEVLMIFIYHILGLSDDFALIGPRATRDAVLDRLGRSPRHAVFACHGEAPQTDVGIAREDDEANMLLSGSDVREDSAGLSQHRLGERAMASLDLRSTALVDLSACWLARGKTSVEGALNLSRACMVAGAQSVIGALSSVYELPTVLLMMRFYDSLTEMELLDEPWRAARSLREAQLWLRSISKSDIEAYLDAFSSRKGLGAAMSFFKRRLPVYVKTYTTTESGTVLVGPPAPPTTVGGSSAASASTASPDVYVADEASPFVAPVFWSPFQVMGRF